MPQSLSAVYVHAIFSTKERRPFLRDDQLRESLHAFMGATSTRLDCPSVRVGGVEDHVHILSRLGRTISQAEWIKELKRVSSTWVNEQTVSSPFREGFAWQKGYACFSVSVSKLDTVVRYIDQQPIHHRRLSFQDELREFLRKHHETWDERYLWD